MKVTCVHCGKDIEDVVQKRTAEYQVGKVNCPHCHKLNKRYLSEMDLHLLVLGNMVVYGVVLSIMCVMTFNFYNGSSDILSSILMTICALFVVIVGISKWSVYVYNQAPMKKEWANYTMKEDAVAVTKSVKRNFYGFIALVIVLGLLAMYVSFWYYLIGIVLYLGLMFIKLKAIQKREKAYYESTKTA